MAAVSKLSASAFRLSACLLALGFLSTASAQTFSTLEERMTVTQFRAAGLDKLTPEELAALNAWLQQKNVAMPQAGAPVAQESGRRSFDSGSETVRSRLPGDFQGWTGKNTFNLENGQVWQQVGSDSWRGVKLQNPTVTITPGFMGSHHLKVEGYNTSTKVKRIR